MFELTKIKSCYRIDQKNHVVGRSDVHMRESETQVLNQSIGKKGGGGIGECS